MAVRVAGTQWAVTELAVYCGTSQPAVHQWGWLLCAGSRVANDVMGFTTLRKYGRVDTVSVPGSLVRF